MVDNYEPDEEYKRQYWMPNETSDHFEQWVLPAYGVHAETEITARYEIYYTANALLTINPLARVYFWPERHKWAWRRM